MLSNRQNDILKIIVEEYIKVPKPIGSKSICDLLNVSSATVRSEMATLEELGFLEKTHVSSGRIPSENGYRYYVDNLMKPKEMSGEDVLKLQTIFQNNSLILSDVIVKSLEIISEMTNYTAVVLKDNASQSKLKKVEAIPINDENVTAILVTDKGHVENKIINIGGSNLDEVNKTVELINKLIVGTPIDEISEKLEYEVKPIINQYVKHHEILYNAFYNAFNNLKDFSDMTMRGKSKLLGFDEFSKDADKIRDLVSKFDSEKIISKIKEDDAGINVYIGKESQIDDDLTIIKTRYNVDGREGTLAILGPKRMEYDRVVSLLEYLKQEIEK